MEHCGKRQSKKAKSGSLHSMSRNDMISFLEMKGIQKVRKLKRQILCELVHDIRKGTSSPRQKLKKETRVITTPIGNFPRYDGANSCYIDSTLVSLFNTNTEWLQSMLANISHTDKKLRKTALDVKVELDALYHRMLGESQPRDKITCKNLRKLFHAFDKEYSKVYNFGGEWIEWTRSQQEPRDVLNVLMNVFDVPKDVRVQVSNQYHRMDAFNSPYVPASDLKAKASVSFADYFPVYDDDVTRITYLSATVVCVNVDRNFLDEKMNTEFVFPFEVDMPDGTKLELRSVIVHHGRNTRSGHYTCVLKMGSKWYHYDDMKRSLACIGSYTKMLNWDNRFVLHNCTNLFYSIL